MRLLDLFCGRWGWSRAFAARGWECVGVDLVEPPEVPDGCKFIGGDVLKLSCVGYGAFCFGPFNDQIEPDFIVASSPCEQFSIHGMKHFHPNPPYPELGIKLFNHTRQLCEASGVPYVMENVRVAQKFVGQAVHHCGPFYLWGNAVPPLVNQGITKGLDIGCGKMARQLLGSDEGRKKLREYRKNHDVLWCSSKSIKRKQMTAQFATIPPELANCVAEYAERLMEQRKTA